MYRTNSNGSQILRRFIQQAESYNRCMFPNNSSTSINKQSQHNNDHVTDTILFCQNGIDNLSISPKKRNSEFVSCLISIQSNILIVMSFLN